MHFRRNFRRLRDRFVQSSESLPPTDGDLSLPVASENILGPRAITLPLVSLAGDRTSNFPAPQPNADSSTHVLAQSSTASQPTAASLGAEDNENDGITSWPRLKSFLRALDQSPIVFGPLKMMTSGLMDCVDIYEIAAYNNQEYNKLRTELESVFKDLEQFFTQSGSLSMTTSMKSLCKSIQKELSHIKGKQDQTDMERHLLARDDSDEILACYQRIQIYLQRLSLNVNLSTWKIVDEQATNALLDRLYSSKSACYNSSQAEDLKRGACTPGTRIEVLGQMHGWVTNPGTGSVYWLNGMAGTGKTTIAYTLCAELEAGCQLGASFFCSRSLPECRDVNKIFPSIAYQLARFSRPFRSALFQVLETEPDAHTRLIRIQFESLIVKPLLAVRDTLPESLVVVIDALDECDNQQSTGRILDALFRMAPDLPIKFVVSSRPEAEIRDQMSKQGDHLTGSRMVLHDLDKGTVQGDIERYLREALSRIHPTDIQIRTLVQRAGILFIYAATVVRYISHANFRRNPEARLQTIISGSTPGGSSPYRDIDELYTVILKAAIDDPDLGDMEREDIKHVLYTVICSRAPLTIKGISGLLQLHNIGRVRAALEPLWSVLHVVETSGLVTTLHASFPDYMFDSMRSMGYHCDPISYDHTLTQHCFDCINSHPCFNICGLETSYLPDDEVPNINAKVEKAIAPELLYACRYWASHLERDNGSPEFIEQINDLLSTRYLLWMEVMNLKECMHEGVSVLQRAERWCRRRKCSEDLIQLTHDAWRFAAAFTSSPVSQSTPHIYVSMLPFWPPSSPLGKHYAGRMRTPVVPQGPAISRRRLDLLATWPVDGEVSSLAWSPDGVRFAVVGGGKIFLQDGLTGRVVVGPLKLESHIAQSVAYSHDGTRVVSGSKDGTIYVWHAESGRKLAGPFQGHKKEVTSLAFSPDGALVVSGSRDSTIRVWAVQSGTTVLGPLTEHTHPINSVAFSHDGTRIVSGSGSESTSSGDNSIRLWDIRTGHVVLGPLRGHTDAVTSVAFSPDRTCIISGSDDQTIRVWDIESGQTVLGPLKGHTSYVGSVGVSPDGARIVSGSSDSTIRVWDLRNGQTVLGLLNGHTNRVSSVAFSPDGTRIISGSYDKTIHLWDVRSGQPALGRLEAHAGSVTSVGFTPTGTRIVSGSHDGTVRVWDIKSGQMVLGPLEGHARPVFSVGVSPDGGRIVSGSADSTICVWDIQSGKIILGPLKRHTDWVNSVVFSSDGTCLVSGGGGYPASIGDHAIIMWDTHSGQIVLGPLKGHTHAVRSVTLSPDGNRIASGSHDGFIRVWDRQNGQTALGPLSGHTGPITSVGFSPKGARIVSGSYDKTIRVWDTQSGKTVLGPLEGHTSSVNSVGFSPDGTRIVSGSSDKTICIWDAQSGQLVLGPLKGHTDSIRSHLQTRKF